MAHTFPSIPGRPGDKDSPAFTMGARYPAVIELNVSIHSPIRVQIPDAFGPQVRSDRPNRHGFSFNGGRGKDDMDGKIEIDPMITHKLSLDDINKGFELMHEGKSIRAVVEY